MKTLYLECKMGAAGDMLMAALLELVPDRDGFIRRMNSLGLPGVQLSAESSVKCGIAGTHVRVTVRGEEEHSHDHSVHDHDHGHSHSHGHNHEAEHSHNGLDDVGRIIGGLDLPAKVRADVLAVYQLIAEAESKAHGKPVEQVHFHEVGALDAIADITGVCLLMSELAPAQIIVSPVHVGSGHVRCAHGIMPVPAPATAHILRDVPIYGGSIIGELCTPTGAALLRHFATSFGDLPVMQVAKIGYGMGKKDFPAANCVRAMLGETPDRRGEVVELSCNLDDMTPEAIGFAMERLLAAGALDVYTQPIGMKKNRPGVLLCCQCPADLRDEMVRLIFKHTTTLGIREYDCKRYMLDRSEQTAETEYGPIRIKASAGWGAERSKLEYEDIARVARERDLSFMEAKRLLEEAL